MQIVNVLRDQHRLHVGLFGAVFLKLDDCFVTWIALFVTGEFEKIVVPLPDGHWIDVKKGPSADVTRIGLTAVALLCTAPEALVPPKSWNTTGCADPSTRQNRDLFAIEQKICRLFWRHLLRRVLELFWQACRILL